MHPVIVRYTVTASVPCQTRYFLHVTSSANTPVPFHETKGVNAREKRHSTDDGQRLQTAQYPLFHAWQLLCAAPSTGLVLRSIDEDVQCVLGSRIWCTEWVRRWGGLVSWLRYIRTWLYICISNHVNIWFRFWRLLGHFHILHFLLLLDQVNMNPVVYVSR